MNEDKEWVEVEVNSAPEAPKADAPAVEVPQEKDEDVDLGARAQKRIRKLLGTTKELREEQQRLKEELQAARKEVEETRLKAQQTESTAYDIYGKSAQDKVQIARKKVKDAFEAADAEGLVASQSELIAAEMELRALDAWKANKPAEPPPPPPQAPQPAPAQLAPATKTWMDKNPWFGRGPEAEPKATAMAVAISDELVEEGYDPQSQEFYEEVERRLVAEMPRMASKLGRGEPETRKPVSVAGQSRTPGRRIRLDEGTVKASQRLGASLEDTARYAEKIHDAGDGYVNIDIRRGRK